MRPSPKGAVVSQIGGARVAWVPAEGVARVVIGSMMSVVCGLPVIAGGLALMQAASLTPVLSLVLSGIVGIPYGLWSYRKLGWAWLRPACSACESPLELRASRCPWCDA